MMANLSGESQKIVDGLQLWLENVQDEVNNLVRRLEVVEAERGQYEDRVVEAEARVEELERELRAKLTEVKG